MSNPRLERYRDAYLRMSDVRIHWGEAESLVGRRLDRRVAYWRRANQVLVAAICVPSIAKMEEVEREWARRGWSASRNSYVRPVIEGEGAALELVPVDSDGISKVIAPTPILKANL